MKQTIEQLWNGNIAPGPNCGVRDPEIERLSILRERNMETPEDALTVRQKKLLQKYADCTEEYSCLLAARAFCDGFSLAVKLSTEALQDDV